VKQGDPSTTEILPLEREWREILRKDVPTDPMMHFEIQDLEPDSHYQLKVRSRNAVDWSEYSEHLFRTAPGKYRQVCMQCRLYIF